MFAHPTRRLALAVLLCLAGCATPGALAPGTGDGHGAADGVALPAGDTALTCPDPADGREPIDLTAVTVGSPTAAEPRQLRVRFTLARPLDVREGVVELALGVYDTVGAPRASLVVRFENGRPSELVYSPENGTEQSVPAAATVTGNTVAGTFPTGSVGAAGQSWHWRAVAETDGSTVDACPAA